VVYLQSICRHMISSEPHNQPLVLRRRLTCPQPPSWGRQNYKPRSYFQPSEGDRCPDKHRVAQNSELSPVPGPWESTGRNRRWREWVWVCPASPRVTLSIPLPSSFKGICSGHTVATDRHTCILWIPRCKAVSSPCAEWPFDFRLHSKLPRRHLHPLQEKRTS
jgi:hypothetical protein